LDGRLLAAQPRSMQQHSVRQSTIFTEQVVYLSTPDPIITEPSGVTLSCKPHVRTVTSGARLPPNFLHPFQGVLAQEDWWLEKRLLIQRKAHSSVSILLGSGFHRAFYGCATQVFARPWCPGSQAGTNANMYTPSQPPTVADYFPLFTACLGKISLIFPEPMKQREFGLLLFIFYSPIEPRVSQETAA
jgi:hypothetical protein